MKTRLKLRPELVVWPLALYAATVLNIPFWKRIVTGVQPSAIIDYFMIGAVLIDLTILIALLLGAFAYRGIFKPVAALLLVTMAASSYYMLEYGTLFDRDMVRNIFETDIGEAGDLVNPKFLVFVALLGLVPALGLVFIDIEARPFWQELRWRAAATAVSVATVAAVTYPIVGPLMSVLRESAMIRYEISPFNLITATSGYARQLVAVHKAAAAPEPARRAADARLADTWAHRTRKTVLVIVLGETARAQNFSLNGYARPTNPELAKIDGVVSFTSVFSCGTATAASVPCMFSGLGREAYTPETEARTANLIDHLKAAGLAQLWRDNQSGCKGVCRDIAFDLLVPPGKLSEKHISFDDRLIENIEPWIRDLEGPGVLYLHMMGSHGPAYFRRYPSDAAVFKPDCQDTRFSHCSNDELVNAYDNTIAYTDRVLASLIRKLQSFDGTHSTAMLYMSDHGESLGEGHVYLHGMPYAIAPEEQRRIPFIFWASKTFLGDSRLNAPCLGKARDARLSHDHLFHTVLGLLDVASPRYSRDLDAFETCRGPAD